MAKPIEVIITADASGFMRAMRRALLSARNVNRARRGLPKVVRPLVAGRDA